MGTTHADYFRGDIPVTRPMTQAEIDTDYEENTGAVIVETFRLGKISPEEVPAVLVANHAPFTWGPDAAKAIENARVLEFIAKMDWRARVMAPDAPRPDQFLSTSITSASTATARTTDRNSYSQRNATVGSTLAARAAGR